MSENRISASLDSSNRQLQSISNQIQNFDFFGDGKSDTDEIRLKSMVLAHFKQLSNITPEEMQQHWNKIQEILKQKGEDRKSLEFQTSQSLQVLSQELTLNKMQSPIKKLLTGLEDSNDTEYIKILESLSPSELQSGFPLLQKILTHKPELLAKFLGVIEKNKGRLEIAEKKNSGIKRILSFYQTALDRTKKIVIGGDALDVASEFKKKNETEKLIRESRDELIRLFHNRDLQSGSLMGRAFGSLGEIGKTDEKIQALRLKISQLQINLNPLQDEKQIQELKKLDLAARRMLDLGSISWLRRSEKDVQIELKNIADSLLGGESRILLRQGKDIQSELNIQEYEKHLKSISFKEIHSQSFAQYLQILETNGNLNSGYLLNVLGTQKVKEFAIGWGIQQERKEPTGTQRILGNESPRVLGITMNIFQDLAQKLFTPNLEEISKGTEIKKLLSQYVGGGNETEKEKRINEILEKLAKSKSFGTNLISILIQEVKISNQDEQINFIQKFSNLSDKFLTAKSTISGSETFQNTLTIQSNIYDIYITIEKAGGKFSDKEKKILGEVSGEKLRTVHARNPKKYQELVQILEKFQKQIPNLGLKGILETLNQTFTAAQARVISQNKLHQNEASRIAIKGRKGMPIDADLLAFNLNVDTSAQQIVLNNHILNEIQENPPILPFSMAESIVSPQISERNQKVSLGIESSSSGSNPTIKGEVPPPPPPPQPKAIENGITTYTPGNKELSISIPGKEGIVLKNIEESQKEKVEQAIKICDSLGFQAIFPHLQTILTSFRLGFDSSTKTLGEYGENQLLRVVLEMLEISDDSLINVADSDQSLKNIQQKLNGKAGNEILSKKKDGVRLEGGEFFLPQNRFDEYHQSSKLKPKI